MAFTKINAAGIGTTETVTVDGLTVINDGSFGGNLSVGGTITYEDVTNVDSVGLITARNGIVVGSGITLSKDGDGFFTGIVTATSFSGSGANLTGIDTDLVSDTSPQLGGNLDVNTKNIVFGDSGSASDDRLTFGAGTDLSIYHDGSNSYVQDSGTGNLIIAGSAVNILNAAANESMIRATENGAVELYYDNSKVFETISGGAALTGTLTATGQLTGNSSNSGKYVRLYGGAGTGRWDIYGHGANLRISDNDTSGSVVVDRAVSLTDNVKAQFGASSDLEIFHDGSNSIIRETGTGSLFIESNTNIFLGKESSAETYIKAIPDGAVELYYNGTKTFETINSGVLVSGTFKINDGSLSNNRIALGNSGDMLLFHDGSENFIDVGTNLVLMSGGSENMARFHPNADVELYYDNSKKFETHTNGVQIHNGGIDLNRQANPYAGAIYFAGFTDTNHMLWHDYWDNPNGTRGSGNGFDGIKWNTYAGIYFYGAGNEAEKLAVFLANGACELYHNNIKQINTHPNGIFVRGIYPMNDNTFDIGSSSQRFKRVYATNGSIQTSDRNQKNTIIESDLGLDFVNKLKPVSYKWNEDDGKTHYGLIAQEVEETLLDIDKTVSDFGAVSKEDDSPMGLSYNEFISPLVKAIQELTAKNDALEARIKTLEG